MTANSACGMTSLPGGHFGQWPRGSCEQCAQCILRLPQNALQLRDSRQRAQILGLCLLHIQFGVIAALEQQLGDFQAAFLKSGIFASDHQPHFHGTDRTVEGGHLRGHQHLHVIVLGNAGEIAGVRGLDAALELAPEIDFPADAEPGVQGQRRGIRCARPPLPCAENCACCLLHLRVERAAGDSELGARFHDAHTGDPHAGIHALRLVNQLGEHGIVEVAPPLLRLPAAWHPGIRGQRLERATCPVGEPGHLRALEVGSYRRAGAEQHGACQARQPHVQPISVRHDERAALAVILSPACGRL